MLPPGGRVFSEPVGEAGDGEAADDTAAATRSVSKEISLSDRRKITNQILPQKGNTDLF